MARSYDKLWKLLIDKKMMRTELREAAGISTNALAKLGKNESVQLQTLEKICAVLQCDLSDIVEIIPDCYNAVLAYKIGDNTGIIDAYVHSGMFQDTILFDSYEDNVDIDLRYYLLDYDSHKECYLKYINSTFKNA